MLTRVNLKGNYLQAGGKTFVPVGVNWIPAQSGMQWPYEWDDKAIETDFSKIHEMGFNLVRFDLVWGWFEPSEGHYNEVAFQQFDTLVSFAHRFQSYLNPALFIGGEVGDAYWDINWRKGRHPHNDEELLFRQVKLAEEFAKRYQDEAAILAWDLTDEPPFWIVAENTSSSSAAKWTQLLCDSIRKYDHHHLIHCGTLGQETNRGPFRADIIAPFVDMLCVHPYPAYDPTLYKEPLLSTRTTYAAAFEIMLSRGTGLPVMMQEFGASDAQFSQEVIAKYYSTFLYSALAAGAHGFVGWCFTDASPKLYKRAPYIRCPHETQFGITDYQGHDKAAGKVMKDFAKVIQQIDFSQIKLPKPQAGIIVPHEWSRGPDLQQYDLSPDIPYSYTPPDILDDKVGAFDRHFNSKSWLSSFILCRQAGLNVGFPRELEDLSSLRLILAPVPATISPNPICHLYTTFWQRAMPVVHSGSVLYASLCAKSAIPAEDIINLFGAQIADRAAWQPKICIKMEHDFYSLKAGEVLEIKCPQSLEGTGVQLDVKDACIIARDSEGYPAIISKTLGGGHSILCAYPLEFCLGSTPQSLEKSNKWNRFYQGLRSIAQIESPYSIETPEVELSWLPGQDRDYVIAINHSPKPIQQGLITRLPGKASLLNAEAPKQLHESTKGFEIELDGFSGCVIEFVLEPPH